MKHPQELGERRHVRINFQKPGFVFPAPDAPWIDCLVLDVSIGGVCLDVGALPVPKIFGLSFDTSGSVVRVCSIVWRRGEFIGARFLSARDLRQHGDPCGEARSDRQNPNAMASRPGLLSF